MVDEVQAVFEIEGHYFKLLEISNIVEMFNDEDGRYYVSVFISHLPTPIVIPFGDNDFDQRRRAKFIDAWIGACNYEMFGDFDND